MGGDPGFLAGSTIPGLLRAPIGKPGITISGPVTDMSTPGKNRDILTYFFEKCV